MRPDALALRLAATPPAGWLVDALERAGDWDPAFLPVLTWHRVDEERAAPDRYPGLISATPRRFDRQMATLAAHATPVSMEQVLAARDGTPLPPRAVLVTFDDAYEDFRRVAWPILRRRRIPATLFVPTAFPGQPGRRFWWDELWAAIRTTERDDVAGPEDRRLPLAPGARRATARRLLDWLKSMPHDDAMATHVRLIEQLGGAPGRDRAVLDWDELRALAADGLTLAAHSRTHPLLTRVPPAAQLAEAAGSRDDLEREIGPVLPVFAYPSGAWDAVAAESVGRAGYDLAFTTDRGVNHLRGAPPLALARINVGSRTGAPLLRAQLLPALRRLPGWVRGEDLPTKGAPVS